MTTPPVPDRLAEIVAQAAARLEAAGKPVTVEAVVSDALRAREMGEGSGAFFVWAFEVAATEHLRERG